MLPAFPKSVRAEAVNVADALPRATLEPAGQFDVEVAGERLVIPDRIYPVEVPDRYESWSATQRLIADCLYTRHHDGRVRERRARLIVEDLSPWVVPFVVHLVGEYVLEIVLAIDERLTHISTAGSAQQRAYGTFAAANPRFLELTTARVISYWDCYYRRQFPALVDYPPHRLITAIKKAGGAAVDATAGNAERATPDCP
ncbi:hypothetical protein SAMN05660748_3966 [Blastococcus aggregatus]|uniref:Uncharacterized protein n=1 Tax=Blastococcus aggregatus TaxID=38502 RepID=A0A285VG92_9ACTN|nr:hypothetical protein [Blastococcus aggregatus]SOC52136.1 hypothetical protein SAMN05660748_3966 [Blastococcus aggregatus]